MTESIDWGDDTPVRGTPAVPATIAQLVHLIDHAGRRRLTPAEHARLYGGVTALAARVADHETTAHRIRAALGTEPVPAATETAGPLVQHWTKEAPRA